MHFAKKAFNRSYSVRKIKGDCTESILALIGSSTFSCYHCFYSLEIKCIKKIGKPSLYISFMKLIKRNISFCALMFLLKISFYTVQSNN